MPRYKHPSMQKMYDGMLALAQDRTSELYHKGAQRRGAGHRCAFWDGFDGLTRTPHATPGSMGAACFAAGREYARMCKRDGIEPPEKAPPAGIGMRKRAMP
jgi:hypothetical protein